MSLDVSLYLDIDTGNEPFRAEFYTDNITHNLGKMAGEVGLYQPLWRPEEIGITHAKQLIEPLTEGYRDLLENREHLQTFNPSHGWGTYDGLVTFVRDYLEACIKYPIALVMADR